MVARTYDQQDLIQFNIILDFLIFNSNYFKSFSKPDIQYINFSKALIS